MADVKLHRPGWTNANWSPHGLFEPIRFDEKDTATLDEDSFNEWVGDDMARSQGVTVTRPVGCPACGASGDDPCLTEAGKKASAPHKDR